MIFFILSIFECSTTWENNRFSKYCYYINPMFEKEERHTVGILFWIRSYVTLWFSFLHICGTSKTGWYRLMPCVNMQNLFSAFQTRVLFLHMYLFILKISLDDLQQLDEVKKVHLKNLKHDWLNRKQDDLLVKKEVKNICCTITTISCS